ncbi:hypothetical protein [Dysgonomonas sp. 511]|uniref:hypothetical protein n=1 Tax=Dysgonomonas sp. 511 TaxID=2302930 RepID=UPI0013CF9A4A|nr:hypothetical protein [Dysgonomonas sp. 511]NDV78148.1 hypothetical protein [Dysgonomonas sp. 511]
MDILNVITTKNATSTTENAVYNLEYSISNSNLIKVMITIIGIKKEEHAEDVYLGHILFENGNITASIIENAPVPKLFSDYENLIRQIKKDVNPQ